MAKPMRFCLPLFAALALWGCGESKPIEFGAVIPLTGSEAIYGVSIRKGVEVAFERLKARKNAHYAITLEVRDSESNPKRAAKMLEEVYEGGALAAIGGVTSKEAKEMVDVADRYDRILLSPSASSPELTGISKNFYRVFPSDFLEGTKMGNFATQTLRVNSVVVLAAESIYGRGSQGVFAKEFERYGGKVLDVLEYPEGTRDFSGLMDRVMTLDPEAVYLADFAGPIAAMVKSLRERHFKGQILTTSAFAAPEVLAAVGSGADGIFLTQPVFDIDSDAPQVKEFVTAYRQKYGEDPGLFAAHGYDAMIVLDQALENAGRATSSEFWKGIRQIHDFEGVTGIIQFDERGDVQKFPRIYTVSDGKLIDYDEWVGKRRQELQHRMEELRRQAAAAGHSP
jgi:branched-chain amino acid transport system substrate-binding protein